MDHAGTLLQDSGLLRPRDLLPAGLLPRRLSSVSRLVLFVCVQNAARSLMAEAFFNAAAPVGWRATSSGTFPAGQPHPWTGPMLAEVGLSLPEHRPRPLDESEMVNATRRITMGCLDSESCPARLRSLPVEDWALPDPSKMDQAGFRRVRDEIQLRVNALLRDLTNE